MPKRTTFLRQAREAAGYTKASDFIKDYGLPESTYRSHDNGVRGLTVAAAKVYARLLARKVPWVTWQYLINGDRNAGETEADRLWYVGAGETVYPFEKGKDQWTPILAPPGMVDPAVAIVRGDSMLPVYRDGDMLFIEQADRGKAKAIIGRDCIVQIEGGPQQIKLVKRSPKKGYFRLYSYATGSESDDVRLASAMPVTWVKRHLA